MFRVAVLCALPIALAIVLCAVGSGPRGPPRLEWTEPVVDIGALGPRELRTLELRWRRRGAGTLRLLAVRAGCGCVAVDAPREPIGPGAEGAIPLRLRAPHRRGPFSYRVRAFTTGRSPHDVTTCRLRGYVASPVSCSPERLDLGRCTPGRRCARIVEVRWAPVAGIGDGRSLHVRWIGVEGRSAVEPPVRRDVDGCLLRLDILVPRAPGAFEGAVALEIDGSCIARLPVLGIADDGHGPSGGPRVSK